MNDSLPSFPLISTLSPVTPTGNEFIQISATQRATLRAIVGLFKDLQLTGFDGTIPLNVLENSISGSDTLLQAIQKLFARVGGSTVAIYPYSTAQIKAIVGRQDSVVFGFKVENSTLFFGFKADFVPTAENSTISGMFSSIASWTQLGNGDSLLDLGASGEFWLNPGRHVSINAAPAGRGIMLSTSLWATNQNKLLSASILSSVNITKSMFGTGGTGEITFLFSKGFDDDPGTPYQVVAAQEYLVGSAKVVVFNKAGYTAST